MAGAQAQHSLGNRETPRIAAGIFPIGGASGQRMRRYFFGASPPGEGPGATGRGRNNRKRQEQQEGAGNNAGAAMPEMPDNAARHANRQAGATCRTDYRRRAAGGTQQKAGSRRRAAGSTRQKAGGGRAAIRWAGCSIAHREDFMYIQTARNGRTMHTPARRQPRAQGIGDRFGTVQTRLRQKSCRQTGTIHRDTGNPPNKGNTADVHKLS